MKYTLPVILILILFRFNAQVSFETSEATKTTFIDGAGAPIGMDASLVETSSGIHLIKRTGKAIVQINYSQELKITSEEKVKYPEKWNIQRLFVLNEIPYLIVKKEKSKYLIFQYHPDKLEFEEKMTLNLTIDDDQEYYNLFVWDGPTKDLYIQLIGGLEDKSFHLAVINQSMNDIVWEQQIKLPKGSENKKGKTVERVYLEAVQFTHQSTFVAYYTTYHQKTREKRRITKYYNNDNKDLIELWSHSQIIENKVSKYFTKPMPFLISDGNIQLYWFEWEIESGQVWLFQGDKDFNKLNSQKLDVNVETSEKMKFFTPFAFIRSIKENEKVIEFAFIENLGIKAKINCILYLEKNGKKQDVIYTDDFSYFDHIEGNIIGDGTLNYYDSSGKLHEIDPKTVFNKFARVKGGTRWKHYNVNGTLYTLYTRYITGSMGSEITRWNFQQ